MNFSRNLEELVQITLNSTKKKERLQKRLSTEFITTCGQRQDDSMSLILINIALEFVLRNRWYSILAKNWSWEDKHVRNPVNIRKEDCLILLCQNKESWIDFFRRFDLKDQNLIRVMLVTHRNLLEVTHSNFTLNANISQTRFLHFQGFKTI